MEYDNIFKCFSTTIKKAIEKEIINSNSAENLEEIRIRINKPIIIRVQNKESILNYISTREDINEIMQRICENSLYSYQKQIANRLYYSAGRK